MTARGERANPEHAASVRVEREDDGATWVVTIARPEVRNAVDRPTARALVDAFRAFDADAVAKVAILAGEGGHFCAGADLRAIASVGRDDEAGNDSVPLLDADMDADGPMGPSRLELGKPVIAAIEGYAVAGGLELALWCDLRVAAEGATFGVFCRRFGVPLIDGGTVRLPRLIGQSRASDLILTGRPVDAHEAYAIGLANRVVARGGALAAARELAARLGAFPQTCMRGDLMSLRAQHGRSLRDAMAAEFAFGSRALSAGESASGASRFVGGTGRHGAFGEPSR